MIADALCNRPDHNYSGFCENCYYLSVWSSRAIPASGEVAQVRILILADCFQQAQQYAIKHHIPRYDWSWIIDSGFLRAFPDAAIHCVSEELFRSDLEKICELVAQSNREIFWE